MQLKLFMVPVENVTAAEAELNAFLRSHRVLAVKKELTTKNAENAEKNRNGGNAVAASWQSPAGHSPQSPLRSLCSLRLNENHMNRVWQRFGVAAKGLQPCVTGPACAKRSAAGRRQLEQQRQQLPDGEPQQQQPDGQQQQPRVPVGAALSSTLRPDGGGADPAAILSSKRSVTRQRSADEGLVLVAEGPPRNLRAFGRQPTALARKTPSKLT